MLRQLKSINEITEVIIGMYNGGAISQGYKPSKNQIKYILHDWRATLIRRDDDNKSYLSDAFFQDLGIVNLVAVDELEDCNIVSGCKVFRTENPIPEPARLKSRDSIDVYLGNKRTRIYPLKDSSESEYLDGNKYTSNSLYYLHRNQYIYIFGSNTIKHINIRGIFVNPFIAGNYNCSNNCFNDDSPWPIALDMITQLRQVLFSGDLKITKSTPSDIESDGQSNLDVK